MTNQEKDRLRNLVYDEVRLGNSCNEIIQKLKSSMWCDGTIRKYYKVAKYRLSKESE